MRAGAVALAMIFLTAACASGLAFTKDDRIEIVSPDDHSKVDLPITVRWRVTEGFEITGPDGRRSPDAGYFGVFVDRAPVPPGKTLAWIAKDDRTCRATPGCPDRVYLNDRDTYATTDTSMTFANLPDHDAYRGHENHQIAIVLLDGTGRRIGESAWFVDFSFDRKL